MSEIYLISDTHFGHANMLVFRQPNGEPLRPFKDVKEMDEAMIERWNKIVRPQDKVYHLGDVAMNRDSISIMSLLNGHKRLVRGNHDIYDIKYYLPFFDEIHATRVLDSIVMSHIPIHPESIGRFKGNIHGHVHNNVPQGHFGSMYYNVSVEMIDYTPIPLYVAKERLLAQQIHLR